jgi:hypothetical protein
MREQEYCDVSDQQALRDISNILTNMNCFENPNKTRRRSIAENISLMMDDLKEKISVE